MKMTRTHRIYNRHTKRTQHKLLFVGSFGAIVLLVCWYSVIIFQKNNTVVPSVKVASSQQLILANGAKLDWPAAGQAAIGSTDDGLLARSSNNEKKQPTASMAKVIAALAVMEKQSFKAGQKGQSYVFTAKDEANYNMEVDRGGSVVPVYKGMELTQYEAIQAMLIASANNVADSLVEKTFGSQEAYISYANDMLHRMGLNNTVVADASGFNPSTASTPSELVMIGIAALKNPVIAEIVAQSDAYIPGVGMIQNTNDLLGANGVIGIKTGTTDAAGNCLLFAARYTDKNGKNVTIVGVIMGDSDATSLFADSQSLLASVREGFGLVETEAANNTAHPHSLPFR